MGTSYSHNEREKGTWNYHCLLFDETTREANLKVIDCHFIDDSEIQLASQNACIGGLAYQHYFITDMKETHFLELSSIDEISEKCYDTFRVKCNTLPHSNYKVCRKTKITLQIKERMIQMLGMCNYSLCLRNSEHVANYIFHGIWASFQMEVKGALLSYFQKDMTEDQRKKINSFPSTIKPKTLGGISSSKLYSIIDKQYDPIRFQYFSDGNDESYNVLVLGPTGAGKSRLINVFFNKEICDSKVSHRSVTREVCFIEGVGEIIDLTKQTEAQQKKIIVADTVGLCDTEWDDDTIFELLRGRISRNFKSINAVFIVFRADRLLRNHVENIKKVMNWLKYYEGSNHLNFLFVGTFAENLNPDQKQDLKKEARDILNLKDTKITGSNYESLVYVGFPPEDQLNDKGREQVKASWDLLQPLMRLKENGQQLQDYKKHVSEEGWIYNQKIRLLNLSSKCTIL